MNFSTFFSIDSQMIIHTAETVTVTVTKFRKPYLKISSGFILPSYNICVIRSDDKLEWFDVLDGFLGADPLLVIIQIDQDVSAVTHTHLIHIGQLTEAMS